MADKAPTAKKGKPKKGKGKVQPWQYVAGGVVVAGSYYLYKKHQANTGAATAAGTSSGVDPNTGVPYASETGAAAIDPNTGVPYSQELTNQTGANAIDPLTGNTYASELTQASVDPLTGVPYSQELAQAQAQLAAVVSGGSGSSTGTNVQGGASAPGGTGSNSDTLNQWKAAILAQMSVNHIGAPAAQTALEQYLKGQPITQPQAAKGLASSIGTVGFAPVQNGSSLPIVVAKNVSSKVNAVISKVVSAPKMPTAKGPSNGPVTPPKKKGGPTPVAARAGQKALPRPAAR